MTLIPTRAPGTQDFPYANFDDPCERGIVFSNTQEPWDNQNVRWAMALATDIKSVGLATFAGILRVSPLAVPPVQAIHDAFHKPMRQWLTEFAFEDGYQPFDPNYAVDIAAILGDQGVEGLSTDEDANWLTCLASAGGSTIRSKPPKCCKLRVSRWITVNGTSPMARAGKSPLTRPPTLRCNRSALAFAVADNWRGFRH